VKRLPQATGDNLFRFTIVRPLSSRKHDVEPEFAGVVYHVTDPTLALRITFNALKNRGTCLLETYAIDNWEPMVLHEGPRAVAAGSHEELNRAGKNWYRPSRVALQRTMEDVGFQDVQVGKVLGDGRL
jgi:hypothetical protein